MSDRGSMSRGRTDRSPRRDERSPRRDERSPRREGGDGESVKGLVKWFDLVKGYGFVEVTSGPRSGDDIFVHACDVEGRPLRADDEVTLTVGLDDRTGKDRACNVRGGTGHDEDRERAKGMGKGGKRDDFYGGSGQGGKPGDWDCPKCGFMNFAARGRCMKCGTDKPSFSKRGDSRGRGRGGRSRSRGRRDSRQRRPSPRRDSRRR